MPSIMQPVVSKQCRVYWGKAIRFRVITVNTAWTSYIQMQHRIQQILCKLQMTGVKRQSVQFNTVLTCSHSEDASSVETKRSPTRLNVNLSWQFSTENVERRTTSPDTLPAHPAHNQK